MNNDLGTYSKQFEDILKTKFGFDTIFIFPDLQEHFRIHATYNCLDWVVVIVRKGDNISEIISRFQQGITCGSWDDTYTTDEHSLAISKLMDLYGLMGMGFFFVANALYYVKPGQTTAEGIVRANDILQYTISLDTNGDFAAIHILTKEHFIVIAYNGYTTRPAYQAV